MTHFFLSDPHYLGIEVSDNCLRVAELQKKWGKWEILSLTELTSEEQILLFKKQIKDQSLISTLNSRDLLVRPCEIPVAKGKNFQSALDFYIEPLLPYPIDKALIQTEIKAQVKNSTFLSIFSIRKDHLNQHLEQLKHYHLEPEKITSKAHALAAFSTLLAQVNSPALMVHEGNGEISFALVEQGKVITLRAIDTKKNLTSEIQKILLNISTTHKTKPYDFIYLLSHNPELKEILQSVSSKTVLLPSSPFINHPTEELITFGLAIGSAMAHREIDFRRKEFSYPYPFKRLKKPLTLYLTLSLILSGSLYFACESFLKPKRLFIHEAYSSLMRAEGTSPTAFLKTPLDYFLSLDHLEKEIKKRPDTYPLLPQIPKVKELLGWLASLRESEGITMESFNYQLVKSPDFSKKQERYKVLVELEISTATTHQAKAFQEVLKRPNPLVDQSEEIVWLPLKGKYKASFYLKDKTRYT